MPRLSIVVPVYDAGDFLEEAVEQVRKQTFSDWELLLFDDGSKDDSRARARALAKQDPRIRTSAHPGGGNRGQYATRVAAAEEVRTDLVALLDQDDLWDLDYLEKHLKRWDQLAGRGVQLSYGPALYWHPDAPDKDYVQPMPPEGPGVFEPPSLLSSFFADQYAATPLPSTTFIRRDVLRSARRFAEEARGSQCEDQYLCWFVASRFRVAVHDTSWVRYRQHAGSALAKMLATPERAGEVEARFLRTAERELMRLHPAHPLLAEGHLESRRVSLETPRKLGWMASLRARVAAPRPREGMPSVRGWTQRAAARGRLAIGVEPLSEAFGEDRGTPLTRHYVTQFLSQHAADIQGRCLEFEGADYVTQYGGEAVTQVDVLDLSADNPRATLIGDLTADNDFPSDAFDSIVCTFVLHEIFDMRRAVRELHRMLRPGGTMLVAVPHVTMCEPAYGERWRFTVQGLTELLSETFPADSMTHRAYGNSLTAAAQLRGLVAEEFTAGELSAHDPRFAIIVCARVQKPAAPARTASARPHSESSAVRPSRPGTGLVLLYHRCTDERPDAHLLSVAPARFEDHLNALKSVAEPLTLAELAEAAIEDRVPDRAVAITFDDGYVDNLTHALPALERTKVPATVFVTSGYVGAEREFWWDALERLFLRTATLPPALVVVDGPREKVFSLGADAELGTEALGRYSAWNVLNPAAPTERHRAFLDALAFFRPWPDAARRGALVSLFRQAGASDSVRESHRVLDAAELRSLDRSPWVEIGAHTVTHAQLSALSPAAQQAELAASRARLEEVLDHPVDGFAYPFGSPADYTAETVELVRRQGFRYACSNFEGRLTHGTPTHEIPRVMVMDVTAEALLAQLAPLWATP
ncbi:MAG: polysaccharide deacetylase family protein [Sandaracinaceae bacterium]